MSKRSRVLSEMSQERMRWHENIIGSWMINQMTLFMKKTQPIKITTTRQRKVDKLFWFRRWANLVARFHESHSSGRADGNLRVLALKSLRWQEKRLSHHPSVFEDPKQVTSGRSFCFGVVDIIIIYRCCFIKQS